MLSSYCSKERSKHHQPQQSKDRFAYAGFDGWCGGLVVGLGALLLFAGGFASGCGQPPVVVSFLDRADFPTGALPSSILSADLNRDGHEDLVVANRGSGTVSVIWNQGRGLDAMARRVDYSLPPGGDPIALALGDLNADKLPDLVVADAGSGVVSVRLNKGAAALGEPQSIGPILPGLLALTLIDWDGDGALDVAASSTDRSAVLLFRNNNNGTARFDMVPPLVVDHPEGAPTTLTAADLDGDGRSELLATTDGRSRITVLRNKGAGAPERSEVTLGLSPGPVLLEDLSGDGRPELLIADPTSQRLGILDGQALPTPALFASGTSYRLGVLPSALGIGDVDGDGIKDLVIAGRGSREIHLLLGGSAADGEERMPRSAARFEVGSDPSALVLSDLNHDGRLDVIVANRGDGTISFLPNGTR